jgi:hypothetical protein
MIEVPITEDDLNIIQGLQYEVRYLLYHWRLFIQLYGGSNENVDVLIGVADELFGVLETLLWDQVLLTIGKLTDHEKTAGQENLTLKHALSILSKRKNPEQLAPLKTDLDALIEKCGLIKTIRHKRLAHFGKEYMIKRLNQEPLPGVNRSTIEEALSLIIKIMNGIEENFGEPKFLYDAENHVVGDELLWYLRECGSYKQVRERAKERKVKELGF